MMSRLETLKNKSDLVRQAYNFAKSAHVGQKRLSGEPYFNHALETAEALADWKLDEVTIAAGLLHDVIEDTEVGPVELEREFGSEIKSLVLGVTKLGRVKYHGSKTQAENIRKLMLAMADDIRVIMIKLADRYHNMKTLSYLPKEKQRRIALETAEIYSPLAYRLGMQRLSGELEDLAFPFIHPREYQWLLENVKEHYEEREAYLERIKPVVLKALEDNKVEVISIDFRAKRYASLYKKLVKYEMDLDRIYDLVAFRIIVKRIEDCYAALGAIHSLWPPLPGKIKDYIALPKPNSYRSLHTTVICLGQKLVEFQIRTGEMHNEAEQGIAANWIYAEAKTSKAYRRRRPVEARAEQLKWLESLRAWQGEHNESKGFLDSLKLDFLKDRIFAVTPKGEVIDLPYGATPVDFAYYIHSEIGDECIGAKVNGKIVPLDYRLVSGDVVEILTQKNKKPSASWLEFVVTSAAKDRIRDSLKKKNLKLLDNKQTELKITAEDRVGLIKDVSSIIARSHVNIISLNSSSRGRGNFHLVKVRCDTGDKDKIWKIILKLKTLKGVKEIDYRFV
ncbi:MAG TPA: RelA/SpoT family protein [Candidatus Paceibacterota bacterium]